MIVASALVLVFLLSMVGKAWLKGLSLAENRTRPPFLVLSHGLPH